MSLLAQKLKPGAPQQPWVQAQTTFAVLARDENKAWQVRALKQKLLVDTVNYEIQACDTYLSALSFWWPPMFHDASSANRQGL